MKHENYMNHKTNLTTPKMFHFKPKKREVELVRQKAKEKTVNKQK